MSTTQRPTPETDAFWEEGHLHRPTLTEAKEFARKLERERDEAREELADIRQQLKGYPDSKLSGYNGLAAATMRGFEALQAENEAMQKIERERDEAREELEAMREAIKEVYDDLITISAHDGPGFPSGTCATLAGSALTKLKPFIKP